MVRWTLESRQSFSLAPNLLSVVKRPSLPPGATSVTVASRCCQGEKDGCIWRWPWICFPVWLCVEFRLPRGHLVGGSGIGDSHWTPAPARWFAAFLILRQTVGQPWLSRLVAALSNADRTRNRLHNAVVVEFFCRGLLAEPAATCTTAKGNITNHINIDITVAIGIPLAWFLESFHGPRSMY